MTNQGWYFLLYRVPAQPSTLRVTVWRKLKTVGGLYVQQAMCILPVREALHQLVATLITDLRAQGGEVELFTVTIADVDEHARLIQRFQQQADAEYAEFCGRCRAVHTELAAERSRSNLTFAELDENETELTKLRAWLPKIRARDWCDAPGYAAAVDALARCGDDFDRFSQEVYHAHDL